MIQTDYRPGYIEFDVTVLGMDMPASLGEFPTVDEVNKFLADNLTAINTQTTASRFMDNWEKSETRKEYQQILEDKLPIVEKELMKAHSELEEAKDRFKRATEYLNATTNEAKNLAIIVKRGVKEIRLDDLFTWRIPFDGRYYFYTYIDLKLRLCKVQEIPDYEKNDLFNAMHRNDEFFNPKPNPGEAPMTVLTVDDDLLTLE